MPAYTTKILNNTKIIQDTGYLGYLSHLQVCLEIIVMVSPTIILNYLQYPLLHVTIPSFISVLLI